MALDYKRQKSEFCLQSYFGSNNFLQLFLNRQSPVFEKKIVSKIITFTLLTDSCWRYRTSSRINMIFGRQILLIDKVGKAWKNTVIKWNVTIRWSRNKFADLSHTYKLIGHNGESSCTSHFIKSGQNNGLKFTLWNVYHCMQYIFWVSYFKWFTHLSKQIGKLYNEIAFIPTDQLNFTFAII